MKQTRKFSRSQSKIIGSTLNITADFAENNRVDSLLEICAPPSRIQDSKWQEICTDEYTGYIINSIREEIIQTAMNDIYEKYLERTSYAFVVHCSYLAWLQLFNWMHLKYDPGESSASIAEYWMGDKEKIPVPMDPWACRNVPIHRETAKSEPEPKSYPCPVDCAEKRIDAFPTIETLYFPTDRESIETTSATVTTASKEQKTDELSTAEDSRKEDIENDDDLEEKLSIFTRTITMPKDDLPMPRWSEQRRTSVDICRQKSSRWKVETAVVPSKVLNVDNFPSNRLDIQYAIMPEHPAPSTTSKMEKKKISK